MDTTGAEESVFFSEVSLFQGLQEWDSIGVCKRCQEGFRCNTVLTVVSCVSS